MTTNRVWSNERGLTGYAVLAFFTVLAGDAWRYSISWYGFGVVALGLTVAGIVILVRARRHWHFSALPYPLVAFLALALASIAWSFYPGASAIGVTLQFVTTIVALPMALLLDWQQLLATLGRALRIILALSLAFELVVAAFVRRPVLPLWVNYGGADVPDAFYWTRGELFTGGRIQGIVGNANTLGMLALIALIVFGIQLASRSVGRAPGIAWLALAALTISLTRSATVTVAIVGVAAVLAAVLLVRLTTTPRIRAVVVSTFAAASVVGIAFVAVFGRGLLGVLGKSEDLTGRLDIWDAVIDLAQQRPVFGWGWVSYWAPWVEPFSDLAVRKGVRYLQAHNAWLDVWLQLGIVGLVILALLVVSSFARSWSLAVDRPQHAPGTVDRYTALSLLPLLVLAALIVQSAAESRLLVEYGWVLLVVVAVMTKRRDLRATPLTAD
jgi:hypothetical protein